MQSTKQTACWSLFPCLLNPTTLPVWVCLLLRKKQRSKIFWSFLEIHYFYDLSQMAAFYPDFFPCVLTSLSSWLLTIPFYDLFWVCSMFFRSTQHRTARVIPLLSHCTRRAVSWVPAELCIYSGCVWSHGLTVLRRLSQRYSRVRCWSLNLSFKPSWSYFCFLYSSSILPWMLRWFSLIFFPQEISVLLKPPAAPVQLCATQVDCSESSDLMQPRISHRTVLHPSMWFYCW